METEERYQQLERRLTALESKVESLVSSLGNSSATPSENDRLASLEEKLDRLQDNLSMISDLDTFSSLRDLLASGKFVEADRETARILLEAIGRTPDTITPADIEAFPVGILKIVDRLWRKYSHDRFGLSVQLKIYKELGGDINTLIAQDEELFFAFCDRVGWRRNGKFITREKWTADLSSPEGFLPFTWWITPYGLKIGNFILARLIKGGF